jgi:hypothetical protein
MHFEVGDAAAGRCWKSTTARANSSLFCLVRRNGSINSTAARRAKPRFSRRQPFARLPQADITGRGQQPPP